MSKIALLVPVCSRGQNYENLSSTPFLKYLYPSFLKHREDYNYTFFIGYDNTDAFYTEYITSLSNMCQDIDIKLVELSGCEHKPARAWNTLFKKAYDRGYDYFYQIGDDIVIESPWTSLFVSLLEKNKNVGVIGACHLQNYRQRINAGKPAVIENAFVHRTHYQIFGTFFDERIDNWYCDDWLTEVYKPGYSIYLEDLFIKNMIIDNRYNIRNINDKIGDYIAEGKKRFTFKQKSIVPLFEY